MKRPLSTMTLLSAAMLATAAPGLTMPFHGDGDPAGSDWDSLSLMHEPPPGPPLHRARGFGHLLAAELSVAETYVGITRSQEDAWRDYTNAMLAFFEHPIPADETDTPASPDDAGPAATLASEHIVRFAALQSARAEALKSAIDSLRLVLDEDQIIRLARSERAIAAPPFLHGGRHGTERPRFHGGPSGDARELPPLQRDH